MNTQAAEALDETETDAGATDEAIVEPTVEAMLEMEGPAVAEDAALGDEMADQDGARDGSDAAPEPDARAEADDATRLAPVLEGLLFAAAAPVPVARLVEALD